MLPVVHQRFVLSIKGRSQSEWMGSTARGEFMYLTTSELMVLPIH